MWVRKLLPLVTSISWTWHLHGRHVFSAQQIFSLTTINPFPWMSHVSCFWDTRLWSQLLTLTSESFAKNNIMCVGCSCMCDYGFCVGTHIQVHRHTCGHACGGQRLMSGFSLSDSLAEPRVHWFSLASQLAPGKRCVCLLRAVLTGQPPGPSAFNVGSEVPDSVVTLEGYTLYPLCHLPSLEMAYF